MEPCSFIRFVPLHLILRCCLVIECFDLPIKMCFFNTVVSLLGEGQNSHCLCTNTILWESELSKAQIVKTGKLRQAPGVPQRALAVLLCAKLQ